jgi:imidazolonepropionase
MPHWDLLLTDARIATLRPGAADYGTIEDGAVAVRDGRIAWIGKRRDLPEGDASETVRVDGRWLTPALIDCHTHLVFAGDRSGEFEQRLQGSSYADIAAAGGGILVTVEATSAAGVDELLAGALRRARALQASGATTIEIKSGYGLDVDNELKMLAAARRLGESASVSVVTTLLAAHAVPSEFRGRADAYVDLVCEELLPRAAKLGLADAVDAYCESIAFDVDQVATIFRRAAKLGLPVKLHADQLSDGGGAALAARFNALSADHLEYASPEGIRALGRSGTVAVLLPGAFLTLDDPQRPPVAALRSARVPIAVATDCNPGTSPLCSLTDAMALAARLFGLTPLECLAGTTREAARALGLADRGTLETGMRADIAVWDILHPRELSYWLGATPLARLFLAGRSIRFQPS